MNGGSIKCSEHTRTVCPRAFAGPVVTVEGREPQDRGYHKCKALSWTPLHQMGLSQFLTLSWFLPLLMNLLEVPSGGQNHLCHLGDVRTFSAPRLSKAGRSTAMWTLAEP